MGKSTVSRDAVLTLLARAKNLGFRDLRQIPNAAEAFPGDYLVACQAGRTQMSYVAYTQLHGLLSQAQEQGVAR